MSLHLFCTLAKLKQTQPKDATEEEVQNLSADRMQGLIKRALEMLFDAHNPDKGTLEDCLKAPERDDIRQSIAHATFSMRGNKVTNVCWNAGSEFDCLLAHFFRAVLLHHEAEVLCQKEYDTKYL